MDCADWGDKFVEVDHDHTWRTGFQVPQCAQISVEMHGAYFNRAPSL